MTTPSFSFWFGSAIVISFIVAKLKQEWSKKNKDWTAILIIFFMAWVVWAINFSA